MSLGSSSILVAGVQEEQQEEDEDLAPEIMYRDHHHETRSPRSRYRDDYTPLTRQSTASSSRHIKCASCGSSNDGNHSLRDGALSPPLLSSPSIASSISFPGQSGTMSPLRRQLSHSTLPDDDRESLSRLKRHDLAKRLTLLAQRLSCGDEVDDSAVIDQVEQLEKVLSPPTSPRPSRQQPYETQSPRSPESFKSPSEFGSVLGSPMSFMLRSQFSDLSIQSLREQERERERRLDAEENLPKMGMTERQAKKVIAEAEKLNDEMQTVINNLRARQEEADHINALLIERAERAAQRIVFLQNRISYLEQELFDNDDELQHLRICLKAVEVQLPPHPDKELQRCIKVFKQDYQSLKQKRATRSSVATITNDITITTPEPTQPVSFTPSPAGRIAHPLYG